MFVFQTLHEQAMDAKAKGNKYFKGQKYEQAIACYSEAMTLCPEDHKEDLAACYQNRAAAYEQLVSQNRVSVYEQLV